MAIDLEVEKGQGSEFWKTYPAKAVQDNALSIFNQIMNLEDFRLNGQIVEAGCDFIKAGYTEEDPSPFKFPPVVSGNFFSSTINLSTPSLNVVMATASTFLASAKPGSIDAEFSTLLQAVVNVQQNLLSEYQVTKQYADHEFTYSSLDFLVRMLPKWGESLFTIPNSQEPLQVLLEFALLALETPDTLPRRSSAAFWAAIFDLSGYPTALSPAALTTLVSGVQNTAARFTAILLRLLGGECARSELDALAEPLKKFVVKQGPLARRFLREAMKEEAGVLSPRALAAVNVEGRIRFLGQVEALRGVRKTNEVVREFWVACRGSAFGYTA